MGTDGDCASVVGMLEKFHLAADAEDIYMLNCKSLPRFILACKPLKPLEVYSSYMVHEVLYIGDFYY